MFRLLVPASLGHDSVKGALTLTTRIRSPGSRPRVLEILHRRRLHERWQHQRENAAADSLVSEMKEREGEEERERKRRRGRWKGGRGGGGGRGGEEREKAASLGPAGTSHRQDSNGLANWRADEIQSVRSWTGPPHPVLMWEMHSASFSATPVQRIFFITAPQSQWQLGHAVAAGGKELSHPLSRHITIKRTPWMYWKAISTPSFKGVHPSWKILTIPTPRANWAAA